MSIFVPRFSGAHLFRNHIFLSLGWNLEAGFVDAGKFVTCLTRIKVYRNLKIIYVRCF